MARRILFAIRAWFFGHRSLVFVTLAALVVRLVWNLAIHKPTDFSYSDMAGYLERANTMLDRPWRPAPYLTLFPYGTHVFVYAVRRVFGRHNDAAVGAAFAILGTLAVSFTYATVERITARRRLRRIAAFALVTYYPWISLGGYALSEIPFTFCVAGTAFFGLRLADRGRRGDAWWLGLFLGMGAAVRPQILVAAALLGLHFLLRRRTWRSFTRGLAVRAAVPLAIILGLSAARIHWHTGHWGLVSQNGPMNAVFGRCHNTGLVAEARDGGGFFGPPALGALLAYEKDAREKHLPPLVTLDPALPKAKGDACLVRLKDKKINGTCSTPKGATRLICVSTDKKPPSIPASEGISACDGTALAFQGHMWDAEPTRELAASCVKKTGWLRQVKYALTHVVLLWAYNVPWPDQGQKPQWRVPMQIWSGAHLVLLLPPAAMATILALRRRRARAMLLALHVWSVVIMAMLYFGDTRYRAPYDGVILILAITTYPEIRRWLARRWTWLRWERRAARGRGAPQVAPTPNATAGS